MFQLLLVSIGDHSSLGRALRVGSRDEVSISLLEACKAVGVSRSQIHTLDVAPPLQV